MLGKIGTAFRVMRTQGVVRILQLTADKLRWKPNDKAHLQINEGGTGHVGVIDVGSVGGLPPEWHGHTAKIRFLLNFEPRNTPLLTDNMITMNTPLWSESCTRDFHIYKGLQGSGSSLFKQNYDYVRQHWDNLRTRGPKCLAETWFDRSKLVRTEKLAVRPLDEVIEEVAPHVSFHFVKIDAQGAEYEILRGAERLLAGTCVGLHLELFVLPLYKGIRLLPEVEQYLAERGFRLAKKFPAHGTFDSQHDCLFLKDGVDSPEVEAIRTVYDL